MIESIVEYFEHLEKNIKYQNHMDGMLPTLKPLFEQIVSQKLQKNKNKKVKDFFRDMCKILAVFSKELSPYFMNEIQKFILGYYKENPNPGEEQKSPNNVQSFLRNLDELIENFKSRPDFLHNAYYEILGENKKEETEEKIRGVNDEIRKIRNIPCSQKNCTDKDKCQVCKDKEIRENKLKEKILLLKNILQNTEKYYQYGQDKGVMEKMKSDFLKHHYYWILLKMKTKDLEKKIIKKDKYQRKIHLTHLVMLQMDYRVHRLTVRYNVIVHKLSLGQIQIS